MDGELRPKLREEYLEPIVEKYAIGKDFYQGNRVYDEEI